METETQPSGEEKKIPVPLADRKPRARTVEEADETVNLASMLDEDEQKRLALRVHQDYEEDVKSREKHMRRLRRWQKLYASLLDPKNWPFQRCANVNLTLLAQAVTQIAARLWDMFWPAKGNPLYTKPSNSQDVDRANRTEKYGNWFLRHDLPDYGLGLFESFHQCTLNGSAIRRVFRDAATKRIKVDWIGVDDFVVNFTARSADPSLRDVRRYSLVLWLSLAEIQEDGDDGIFVNTETLTADASDQKETSEFKQTILDISGMEPSTETTAEDLPRMVIEQHRWWRFKQKGSKTRGYPFDGRVHPVVVTVDEKSKKLLRVVLREEDDPRDVKRYAREMQAYARAQQMREAYGQTVVQASQGLAPMPAQAPEEPKEPEKPRKREICFFTHLRAFPSEGFYGLGLGDFIGPLNEAANIMVNQTIDRATLQNAGGGFISRQLRGQRGEISIQPGQFTEVDAPAAVVKDGIVHHQYPPLETLPFQMAQYIGGLASSVSGSAELLSGEPSGANETATAVKIKTEMALKPISILQRRISEAMPHEYAKIWRLLSVYLDEEEYVEVTNADGSFSKFPISKADFVPDAHVLPAADPRASSRTQRVEEAINLFGMVMQNPLTGQNPAMIHAATVRVLEAYEEPELIRLLGPPPGPPQPPQPKQQWEENAGFLRGQDSPVLPQDDDHAHFQEMSDFRHRPEGYESLSPDGKKLFDQHARTHLAQMLEKRRTADDRGAGPLPEDVGGGEAEMAGAA